MVPRTVEHDVTIGATTATPGHFPRTENRLSPQLVRARSWQHWSRTTHRSALRRRCKAACCATPRETIQRQQGKMRRCRSTQKTHRGATCQTPHCVSPLVPRIQTGRVEPHMVPGFGAAGEVGVATGGHGPWFGGRKRFHWMMTAVLWEQRGEEPLDFTCCRGIARMVEVSPR